MKRLKSSAYCLALLGALTLPIMACDSPQAPPVEQDQDKKDNDGKTSEG